MYEARQNKEKVSRVIRKTIQKIDTDGKNMEQVDATSELIPGKLKYGHAPVSTMTRHHIIPRNRLVTFWNTVKSEGHLKFLSKGVLFLVDNAIKRNNTATDLQVNGSLITSDNVTEYMKYMYGTLMPMPRDQREGASVIETIFQWWPANIHYGPTNRLKPGDSKYDKSRDDGGDEFEESAQKTVKNYTYSTLKSLNEKMETYIRTKNKTILIKINELIRNLSSIQSITPFDKNRWVCEMIKGKAYWRFKK